MVKKNKRKKLKRTRKKQSTEQHLFRSAPPGIKISEAILTLCEPLRKRYTDPESTRSIIWMTIIAWNISLFSSDEQQLQAQKDLLNALPKELEGPDVAVLLENIDELVKRKNQLYPGIREYILNHELSFSDDLITLTVGAVPIHEKNKVTQA